MLAIEQYLGDLGSLPLDAIEHFDWPAWRRKMRAAHPDAAAQVESLIGSILTPDDGRQGKVERGVFFLARDREDLDRQLEIYKAAVRQVRRVNAKRAAKAPRRDALQNVIIEILKTAPTLTWKGVLRKLDSRMYPGVITSVSDRHIEFIASNDKVKDAPISGLKDRVSRAKIALFGRST